MKYNSHIKNNDFNYQLVLFTHITYKIGLNIIISLARKTWKRFENKKCCFL